MLGSHATFVAEQQVDPGATVQKRRLQRARHVAAVMKGDGSENFSHRQTFTRLCGYGQSLQHRA
jgi:hypothetical protein